MWIYHKGNNREYVLCFLFNAQCCFKSAQKFGYVGSSAALSSAAALSCEAQEKLMLSSDVFLQIWINCGSHVCWKVPLHCSGTNTKCPVG